MKTKNILILLSTLFILLINGCEDKTTYFPKMEATIGGEAWKALTRKTNLTNDDFYTIIGTSTDGKILEITIKGAKEGVYQLSPISGKAQCLAVYKTSAMSTSSDDIYTSYSGEVELITINSSDKRISGIFDFQMTTTAADTISVSSGVFSSLKYTTGD